MICNDRSVTRDELLQGYCDVFFKCRAVDAEGPLARLKNMLFNKETLNTVAQWVQVCIILYFNSSLCNLQKFKKTMFVYVVLIW